jgi:molybdate transport system substrate-binding protein
MKKLIALLMTAFLLVSFAACAQTTESAATEAPAVTEAIATEAPDATEEPAATAAPLEAAEVQLFIAASLEGAFQEIIPLYNATQPNVTITYNADSSGSCSRRFRKVLPATCSFPQRPLR